MEKKIKVVGARVHNLKNITVEIPRDKFVVITGLSGSGKSSVVFAGLVPKLREQGDWLILKCRPGGYPFEALAKSLIPFLEPEMNETDQLIETRKLADALKELTV